MHAGIKGNTTWLDGWPTSAMIAIWQGGTHSCASPLVVVRCAKVAALEWGPAARARRGSIAAVRAQHALRSTGAQGWCHCAAAPTPIDPINCT
jgi:hypothetical protein